MRKTLIALAAGLMAVSALPAAASASSDIQARPYMQDRDHNGRNDRHDNGRWGRWDNRWGHMPPAPPRHWTRQSDWYRHVHACQVRYRSYNPRTDTFTVRRGVVARCRL